MAYHRLVRSGQLARFVERLPDSLQEIVTMLVDGDPVKRISFPGIKSYFSNPRGRKRRRLGRLQPTAYPGENCRPFDRALMFHMPDVSVDEEKIEYALKAWPLREEWLDPDLSQRDVIGDGGLPSPQSGRYSDFSQTAVKAIFEGGKFDSDKGAWILDRDAPFGVG